MVKPIQLILAMLAMMVVGCSRNANPRQIGAPIKKDTSAPVKSQGSADADEGVQMLDRLLTGPPLRLTADGTSWSRRFHFASSVASFGDGRTQRTANTVVVRDGTQVAVLCMSEGGLPYCFMTRGFLVCLDPSRAGGFIFCRGGSPTFELTATADNRLHYNLSYVRTQQEPTIDLNLSALLRSMRARVRSATFDVQRRKIEVRTEHADASVSLAPVVSAAHVFPIRGFGMENLLMHSAMLVVDISADSPGPLKTQSVTEKLVRNLGLPVRIIEDADERTIDLLVPLDFGRNPLEREAARRLGGLLNMDNEKQAMPPHPALERMGAAEKRPLQRGAAFALSANLPTVPAIAVGGSSSKQ